MIDQVMPEIHSDGDEARIRRALGRCTSAAPVGLAAPPYNAGIPAAQSIASHLFCHKCGGCSFNDPAALPLSRSVRKRIAQITQTEQKLGCTE